MTLIQTIRTSPAKANDLFARIAATTPGAVKTRQGLFAELKAELELHAALEHDHLLPALKKHAATKDMSSKIGERLRDLRTLMARIEKAPVDGDGFLGDIAELKRLFQAHVRDEKSELLPAIKKALSDEEAARVGERMEADRVAAEKAEQDAAEQRRAEARRERDRVQALEVAKQAAAQKAEQDAADKRRADARRERDRVQALEAAKQKAEQDAADKRRADARRERDRVQAQEAADLARRDAERAEKKLAGDATRASKAAAKAAQAEADLAARAIEESLQASQGVALAAASQAAGAVKQIARQARPFAGAGQMISVMSKAGGEVSATWSGYARKRLQNRVAAWSALAQCRTPADLISLQVRLVRDEVGLLLDTSGRATEVASQAAADATAVFAR